MNRRLPGLLVAATAGLALFAMPAYAQEEPPPPPETPPAEVQPPPAQQAPAPKPKSGRMRLTVPTGLRFKGAPYVLSGQRVTVAGRVKPYVKGQTVTVRISSKGRKPTEVRARVRGIGGGFGGFTVTFTARRAVNYAITARHAATDQQVRFDARAPAVHALSPAPIGQGAKGLKVRLMQSGLRVLGFPGGSGDYFSDATARAVLAFRKTNNLGRDYRASTATLRLVFQKKGRFQLRHPKAGKHVEADLSRQVIALADGGKAIRVYHTSTGSPYTPTIRGSFRFYLKSSGTNAKGMVHSSYFIRGYAIHGYASVPLFNASHGCLRVPIPSARSIFDWINVGDRIFVYW
jgi:peptidoglycan hydrolase-like protein with peptidoglycan-binding domain